MDQSSDPRNRPVNSVWRPSRVALSAFFLLLPGFFAYHFLLAKSLIPPWLGGYSSAMALIWLLPLSALFLQQVVLRPTRRCTMDAAFMAFLGYYLVVLLLNMGISQRGAAAADQIGVLPQFFTLYVLGRLVPPGDHGLHRALIVSLLAMSLAIVTNADEGTFFAASFELLATADYFANYQAYGFIYTVCLLYVLCATPQPAHRAWIYAFALPTLFLNGARTELIGVVALSVTVEFMLSRRKWLMFVMAASLVAIAIAALPILADFYPESRTIFLFLDYSDDLSKIERTRMLEDGWNSIQQSPWLGALGSHRPGEHIHNALSAWVDLGLIGFAAYSMLIACPVIDLLVLRRLHLRDASYRLAFSFIFLVALFAITAKHFTHQLLPLALGAYARVVVSTRPSWRTAPIPSAA